MRPGGLGVFDAAMLVALWQFNKEDLLAGLLLFRLLYYLCPFVVALVILGIREFWLNTRRTPALPEPPPARIVSVTQPIRTEIEREKTDAELTMATDNNATDFPAARRLRRAVCARPGRCCAAPRAAAERGGAIADSRRRRRPSARPA